MNRIDKYYGLLTGSIYSTLGPKPNNLINKSHRTRNISPQDWKAKKQMRKFIIFIRFSGFGLPYQLISINASKITQWKWGLISGSKQYYFVMGSSCFFGIFGPTVNFLVPGFLFIWSYGFGPLNQLGENWQIIFHF